ncbi:cystathionine gamma-synthase family protein [Aliiglaciecola sp. LCG003]|uniref:cystathionine gamma-synthase family protein n=1 Tax=Aliiglaciecola sp. LCG003 TaxID=3053655 RepID=UPI0025727927|nr:cystathionine gamma-synthase family protein [Aliiglaciecola sp. LCG003]WJG07777.1 cystathionine gamma-synthase family protein [Aliiglaciecola sp. LCG003]
MKIKGITTRLVHADRNLNQPQDGAVHFPTSNSVLFEYKDVNDLVDVFQGKKMGHVYSRSSSSSNSALQKILAELEGGVDAATFATGMAAISAALLSLLKCNDHIVVSQFLFGNTRSFMNTLENFGIEISYVDVTDVNAVARAVRANTRLVFTETIANPVTQVADLAAVGQLCAEHKLVYMIDNTMTPGHMFDAKGVQASLTVMSLTKYFAGHGNVLGGAIVDTGLFDWSDYPNIFALYRVGDPRNWGLTQIRKKGLRDMGATLPPHSAQQISIGLETLALRLERCCNNALRLATYLHGHAKVAQVYYPGLSDHPQHYIAREMFKGSYGGIFSMDLVEGADILAFLNHLDLVITATHLGDTRTLALPVASTIFYESGAQERAKMGINDNMIRFSVGIEDIDDIVADFEQAFNKI